MLAFRRSMKTNYISYTTSANRPEQPARSSSTRRQPSSLRHTADTHHQPCYSSSPENIAQHRIAIEGQQVHPTSPQTGTGHPPPPPAPSSLPRPSETFAHRDCQIRPLSLATSLQRPHTSILSRFTSPLRSSECAARRVFPPLSPTSTPALAFIARSSVMIRRCSVPMPRLIICSF